MKTVKFLRCLNRFLTNFIIFFSPKHLKELDGVYGDSVYSGVFTCCACCLVAPESNLAVGSGESAFYRSLYVSDLPLECSCQDGYVRVASNIIRTCSD